MFAVSADLQVNPLSGSKLCSCFAAYRHCCPCSFKLCRILSMASLQIFLEQGQYQAVETSRQEAGAAGKGKASKDRIHRTIGRQRPIRYEITDRPPSDKATWDRVVALFCLGKAWQFKAYPKALFPVGFLTCGSARLPALAWCSTVLCGTVLFGMA